MVDSDPSCCSKALGDLGKLCLSPWRQRRLWTLPHEGHGHQAERPGGGDSHAD